MTKGRDICAAPNFPTARSPSCFHGNPNFRLSIFRVQKSSTSRIFPFFLTATISIIISHSSKETKKVKNVRKSKSQKVKKSNTKSKILYLARTLFSVGGGTLNLSLKRSLKIINQKKAAETESNGRSPMGQENGLAIERGQWRVDIGELILVIRFGIRFGIQLAISWVDRSPNP